MESRKALWTVKDVLLATFILALLWVVGLFLGFFVGLGSHSLLVPKSFAAFFAILVVYGAMVVVVWWVTIRKYKVGWRELGFVSFNFWKSLGVGLLWLAVLRFLTWVYGAVASLYNINPPSSSVENIPLLFGKNYFGMVMAVLAAGLVAPLAEEIFFRGFIYSALRRKMRAPAAIFVSSMIFALFHFNLWVVIPVILIGIVLALLYEKTGSLGPSVVLHSLYNLFSVVAIYFITVSGRF